MDALSLIKKKHAGGRLSAAEIAWLVQASLTDALPNYQLAVLLMVFNYEGLDFDETVALTRAFVDSGVTLEWPDDLEPIVDKHSTGGVGDKVSLLLTPWLAAAGLRVAKMSGRGLGHTGGTIDKLESIPGFNVKLSQAEMLRVLREVGCVIVEQSAELVPADKKWYALRDVTDTVAELGLIAASVMSKKLACGAKYIVLDVKCGSGAFFKTVDEAREFARLAKRIGEQFGRKVACVISNMDQPLGNYIGTMYEVGEAWSVLHSATRAHQEWFRTSGIPESSSVWNRSADLIELCETIGACLLVLTKRASSAEAGKAHLRESLESGAALQNFYYWIAAQGGDWATFDARKEALELELQIVTASTEGYVQHIDAQQLGNALVELGAGRRKAGAEVRYDINLILEAQVGSRVASGDYLLMLTHPGARLPAEMHAKLAGAFTIGPEPPDVKPIILDVLL